MLDVMDSMVEENLARVRDILARLRRLRSGSSASSQRSSASVKFRWFQRAELQVEVEDWPEFQCVWKDLQHIKAKIPASGARRIACMRSGGGWKRCTETISSSF